MSWHGLPQITVDYYIFLLFAVNCVIHFKNDVIRGVQNEFFTFQAYVNCT